MDRREALKIASLLTGYTLVGSSAAILLNGCKADTKADWTPSFLTEEEWKLVADISEIILPATDTPGAKDALCDRYIDQAIHIFYSDEKKEHFREDLTIFDAKAKEKYTKAFLALNQNEKEKVLDLVAEELKAKQEADPKHRNIFRQLRELVVTGYCTSEVGAKGGLFDFRPVPGPYQGCIEYSTVGKAWAL